jgi:hypothetical protein
MRFSLGCVTNCDGWEHQGHITGLTYVSIISHKCNNVNFLSNCIY